MSVGDPACDLVMYWNFFDEKSKKVFKLNLNLDENTWNRARGWALWKACFELIHCTDGNLKNSWLKIIDDIVEIE